MTKVTKILNTLHFGSISSTLHASQLTFLRRSPMDKFLVSGFLNLFLLPP